MDTVINRALSNNTFFIFLTLVLSIVGGKTIYPIPRVIHELLNKSFIFKYIIMVLVGLRLLYPVNNKQIISILIFSLLILCSLEFLRKYD